MGPPLTPLKCILCQHPSSGANHGRTAHTWLFACPRCGDYHFAWLLWNASWPTEGSFRLACVAHAWHLKNHNIPFLLTDEGKLAPGEINTFSDFRVFTVDEMYREFPKPTEIVDQTLIKLSQILKERPFSSIRRSEEDVRYLMCCEDGEECLKIDEYMKQRGLYTSMTPAEIGEWEFSLTPAGWERIEKITKHNSESKQAFIAMWFDPKTRQIYEQGIKPAIEGNGYLSMKIDEKPHNNDITDEILAEICKSRFVVADFTGQRGGVYFEAGYAMGIGVPVIRTVHRDDMKNLHFDMRQYQHITYANPAELQSLLRDHIAKTIR